MTTELQRAMARYEAARIEYKKAVLASMNDRTGGEGIRAAIREFQRASADLRKLRGAPPRPAAAARFRTAPAAAPHRAFAGLSFFRRLLDAS